MALLLPLLAAMPAYGQERPNLEVLQSAKGFAICQPGKTEEDVRALREMGVDVVVRGVHGAWHQSPGSAKAGQESKLPLMALARELGICFVTMVTSSAIYESDVPEGRYEAMVARDAHGRMIPTGDWHQGCLSNPEFREYVKRLARGVIDGGADGIHYDESYGKYYWGQPVPGFCDHCCNALREHLREKYDTDTLRARFSVEDLEGFEYRSYLAERELQDRPWESPLHDEWWLYQLYATFEQEREIVADSKARAEELGRDLVTNANQYDMATHSAILAMESAVYDNVNVGTGWNLEFRGAEPGTSHLRLPPKYSFVPMYRMTRAATPEKPVSMFLDIQRPPDFFAALPEEQQGRVLEWLSAEAYASGCFHALHHRFSLWEGPREAMKRCGQFFAQHHDRYYAGTRPEARIGVVYSFASYIWDMYPTRWDGDGPAHCREYYGVCQALLDANLQFDTVFLGEGRIFPEEQPDRLSDFDVVIAPSAYALTDGNANALASYVATGGKLVRSGPLGEVDEENRPRAALPPELSVGHPGIHELRGDYEEYLAAQNPDSLVDLGELLVGTLGLQPTVTSRDLEAKLQLHVRRHDEGDRLLIDVINRDFELGRGFEPAEDTQLILTLPTTYGLKDKTVRALSPDSGAAEGELTWAPVKITLRQPMRQGLRGPLTLGGRSSVRITLPRVDVYTLVVIE